MSRRGTDKHLLSCVVDTAGDETVLRVTGEIDLASVSEFRDRLREVTARGAAVTLDLRGVSYMGSTGLHALERATQSSSPVTILVAPGSVSRLLATSPLDERLTVRQMDEGEAPDT
jgi:anti-anti-sigma factor